MNFCTATFSSVVVSRRLILAAFLYPRLAVLDAGRFFFGSISMLSGRRLDIAK